MSESPLPASAFGEYPPGRRKRRLWLWVTIFVVVPVACLAVLYFYQQHLAERDLQAAIAETDRLDPCWRLEDIEKQRAAPPPEENAALHISTAATVITPYWATGELNPLADTLPQCQIDTSLIEPLRKALQPSLAAQAWVQKAALLPSGRFPVSWAPDGISTMLPHLLQVRIVGEFLSHLAMLQIHEGKHEQAWQTSMTIFMASRTLADEPTLVSQLTHIFVRSLAMESLERCLAHGKVTDTLLAEAQANLLREAAEPVFFVGMRGERAHQHRIFLALEDGTLPKSAAFPPPKKFGDYFHFAHGYSMKEQHAWMLRWMNDVVEVSKLPPGEQLQRFPELMRQAKNAPPTARMLVSAFNKVGEAAIRSSVKLNCAATAIAVERFRLKFNRWPDSLDEVVAEKLLDEIPQDPYDGKPLRYRKTKDGVVIYSIGTKKDYGGDMLDEGRTPPPNTYRYEFLLWDEAHRRQPSRPQPKGDEEKKNGGV